MHFTITYILSSESTFTYSRHGHVLAILTTEKCLRLDPQVPCYGPELLQCFAVKVNLHSIRFSSVSLRFCFLKKYALFHPHFYQSTTALSRLLYIDKNFVQKFCV